MFFTDTISIPSVVKQWRSVVTDREPPSTWMEATKAYRRGALIHHPDKCRGNGENFKAWAKNVKVFLNTKAKGFKKIQEVIEGNGDTSVDQRLL